MNLRFFISIMLVLLTASCSENPQKPDNLIDEDTYTDLLIELQLIRSYGENAETDSTTIDSLTTDVFQKYDVSAETFMESHRYYEQFPQEQKERTEEAIERLKMDKVENFEDPRDTVATDQ